MPKNIIGIDPGLHGGIAGIRDDDSAKVSPPGRILSKELEARGWTQKDLSEIMGRPTQAIDGIIKGSKQITPETAIALSNALGTSAELWTNLESNYRLHLSRHKVDDDSVRVYPMPVAGKELDLPSIVDIVLSLEPEIAIIEKVGAMPKQGLASTFKFGAGYGSLQGILAALKISYVLVTPQSWKKVVLEGTKKDKNAAIEYCRRMHPDINLVPTERSRKAHDGMADALCLMDYGRIKFGQVLTTAGGACKLSTVKQG